MAKVHCVMQAKGGTGKSLVAALLAQFLARGGATPLCIDADPVHATFSGYTGLAVRTLPWHGSSPFDARAFDTMLQSIAQTSKDVVIDSSASVCLPLLHYLAGPRARGRLARISHHWVVHTLVVGGPGFLDTLDGFGRLVERCPPATRFALWLNPYWGELAHQGQEVETLPAYQAHRQRLKALLRLPALNPATDGRVLAGLLRQRLTFDEALRMDSIGILERQRMKQLQRALFAQLDMAMVQ